MNRLVQALRLYFVAQQFLTRLPVPQWVGWDPAWLDRSVRCFPLVGVVVGAWGAALALGALWLWPPWVAATLSVAGTLWLCAAFHEDGLADTFDALLGAAPRERALQIMKDSRIGTYGAAALALRLLLRVLLLGVLLARDPLLAAAACVAAHSAGRSAAVGLMALLPYAGDEAHAKAKPLAREVGAADVAWSAGLGAAVLLLAGAAAAALLQALAAAAALLSLVAVLRIWLRRRLGGYTGDTLGAAEQLGEIVVLLAFAAVLPR